MNPLRVEINNQYKFLIDPEPTVHALIEAIQTSGEFPIEPGELSIVFVDDTTIGQIHNNFMGDPSATDVITFPADLSMESAGEIIVSVDHAIATANEMALEFSFELSLYLLHGWLHLAGYDDHNEKDIIAMRDAEARALALVSLVVSENPFRLESDT